MNGYILASLNLSNGQQVTVRVERDGRGTERLVTCWGSIGIPRITMFTTNQNVAQETLRYIHTNGKEGSLS